MRSEPKLSARPADFECSGAGVGDLLQLDGKNAIRTATPKKRPQDEAKKRHDIINPVCLRGVIREGDLKALLKSKGQFAWCSRVRVCGLLVLVDYMLRNRKNGTVHISADLSRSYISKVRNNCPAGTIKEALPLLCHIGIFDMARRGVHAHVRSSARYRLTEKYSTEIDIHIALTSTIARKLATAESRLERRLNRTYPYREELLRDLRSLSFAPEARPVIAKDIVGVGSQNLSRLLRAIDGGEHYVRVSERGQITTSIGSCPRQLQPHLLLQGQKTTCCDIAAAHWNFLPRVLADRLRYLQGQPSREDYVSRGWCEHGRLILLLSSEDFYRQWCADPEDADERDQKKMVLNMLLNRTNADCLRNRLYRWVAAHFPITFGVIEDIKRKDHRNLSKQLQRFTADAIATALRDLQQQGIAAIPHVDALICQEKDHDVVCEAIGKQIFLAAGVRARVGGVRC